MPTPIQPRRASPAATSALLVIFCVLLLVATGTYTIQSGTVGVLSTFGEYDATPKKPGLHFKVPLIQDVHLLDIKMQTANYQEIRGSDKNGVIFQPRIVVLDSKNLNIGIDITVQFIPQEDDAKQILANYGTNYFQKLIGPIIRDTVRDVVSQYQAEDIAKQRSAIAEHLNGAMADQFAKIPFALQAVQLRDIDLPKIVRDKIEEVQLAKQEEQRLIMIEKQAEKQQHIKTIEANTQLIEITTKAKAQAEQKRIAAEAEAYKIQVQAEAQAEANRILAESLDEQVIHYRSIEKWSGNYPSTLVGDKEGMILNLPKQ